jgi:hypothetical protein
MKKPAPVKKGKKLPPWLRDNGESGKPKPKPKKK